MLRRLWRNAAARVIPQMVAGSFLLLGCSAPPVTTAQPGAPKGFTVDTPLDVIAADARGKAVLVHDVPGVMSNPRYPLYEDMSLSDIAIIARGKLPRKKLDEVQADLNALAAQEAAGR